MARRPHPPASAQRARTPTRVPHAPPPSNARAGERPSSSRHHRGTPSAPPSAPKARRQARPLLRRERQARQSALRPSHHTATCARPSATSRPTKSALVRSQMTIADSLGTRLGHKPGAPLLGTASPGLCSSAPKPEALLLGTHQARVGRHPTRLTAKSRHQQARPPPAMAHLQGCNEPPFWGVSHEAHGEPREQGPNSRRNPPLASRPSHPSVDCDHPRGQRILSLGWQPRERVLRTLHDGR